MVSLAVVEWLVTVAYLAPVLLVLGLRARRDTPLWELALDVPVVVAADLLLMLALTRVLTLERSAFVSRALWLCATVVAHTWKRAPRTPIAWPRAVDLGTVLTMVVAAAVVLLPFLPFSRTYNIHDRGWHGPLVAALQVQKLPFRNVFDPDEVLHYHLAGDFLAAALRAFSFDVLSSGRALALAHDLFLAMTAAWIALVCRAAGARRTLIVAFAAVAVVWHAPFPRGLGTPFDGQNFFYVFADLTYRPHVPVAFFGAVVFVGVLALRGASPASAPPGRALLAMASAGALLSVSDEASAGVLGLALGLTWLVAPSVLGLGRLRGMGALVVLGAAVVLPNLLASATLSHGGPLQTIVRASPARLGGLSPGVTTPLFTEDGLVLLGAGLAPVFLCVLALVIAAALSRSRPAFVLAVFGAVATVLSVSLATGLTFNSASEEGQRFFVAPFVAALIPVVVMGAVLRWGPVARGLVVLALAVPAVHTLYFQKADHEIMHQSWAEAGPWNAWVPESLFDVDCRRRAGAHLGEQLRPVYLDRAGYYLYSTCRPVFLAGGATAPWPMKVNSHPEPLDQLRDLAIMSHGASFEAICRVDGHRDVLCSRVAADASRCTAEGSMFLRCPVTDADRAAVGAP